MAPCESCRENLLEYLYGLLESDAANELEQHALKCEPCQAHLEEAKRAQGLLSKAAHVVRTVEPFTAPGSLVVAETTLASAPSSAPVIAEEPTPQTLPMDAAPRQRSKLRRYWPAWSAAAGLLFAYLLGQHFYHQGHEKRAEALAQAKKDVEKVEAKFASLEKSFTGEQQKLQQELVGSAVHVHAMGPTQYHSAVPAICRVTTRDIEGRPAKAEVTLKIVDQTDKILFEGKTKSNGEVALTIPAGLEFANDNDNDKGEKSGNAKLILETTAGTFSERIEEPLRAAPLAHTTHIALNKNTFNVGEVMFFRTLTLERVSHQPPKQPIPLNFSLLNDQGKEVYALAGTTGPGGISAGNFALTEELANGTYTLVVRPDGKAKDLVLPQAHPVEILSNESLEIEFDRQNYKAGETVNAWAKSRNTAKLGRGGARDGKKKTGEAKNLDSYDLRITVDGRPVPALNAGAYTQDLSQKVTLDALGNAMVQFKLPAKIERGDVVMELAKKAGIETERYVQPVPVVPSELHVDFFPEGGELVPGVSNKVYYRVRSPWGDPVDPDKVVLRSTRGILHESEPKSGLGWFNFVPKGKEKYAAELSAKALPTGKAEIADPFRDLTLLTEGVALHVPQPVAKAGEPVDYVLRNPGPNRRLLLVATSRGVVFDQQVLSIKKGDNEGRLTLPDGVDGLLRITLLELAGEVQEGIKITRPLAERLVFRSPARHLVVSCEPMKGPHQPGQKANLNIDVRDEKNKETNAWMLASVVDEKAVSPYSESAFSGFFQIASNLSRGQDLDLAFIHLNEEKKDAARALDLFLGTHGWRRFVPELSQDLVARLETLEWKDESEKVGKQDGAKGVLPLPIFSRENRPLLEQRAAIQTALLEKSTQKEREVKETRSELVEERERALVAAKSAAENLRDYEVQTPFLVRGIILTVLYVSLFASALLALLLALYRYSRSQAIRAPVGVSFVCSALAFCLLFVGPQMLPEIRSSIDPGKLAWLSRRPWPELQQTETDLAFGNKPVELSIVGRLGLKAPENEVADPRMKDLDRNTLVPPTAIARLTQTEGVATEKRDNRIFRDQTSQGGVQKQSLLQLAENPRFEPVPLESFFQSEELQERYRVASKAQRTLTEKKGDDKGKKDDKTESTAILPIARPSYASNLEAEGKSTTGSKTYDDAGKTSDESLDLLVREYTYRAFPIRPLYQPTVSWHPTLAVENGKAALSFDLSPDVTSYRVLLIGNSSTGRLGMFEGRLEVQPENAKK